MMNSFRKPWPIMRAACFVCALLCVDFAIANPSEEPNTQALFDQWMKKNAESKAQTSPQARTSVTPAMPNANNSPEMNFSTNESEKSPSNQPARGPTDEEIAAFSQTATAKKKLSSYERGQQVLLNSVPESNLPETEDETQAFNTLLKQNIPLNPKQVVTLHQQVDIAQRAASIPATIPPKPVSTTLMVNLAPGATPPAIRLAQGYVSSLVFVDSTGTPWPIAAFDVGSPKAVNIQWDGKSNILLIQSLTPYSYGDIVIRLVGLPTPITMELVSGQRVVDYRLDVHVSGIGPNTKDLPAGTNLPNSANQLLLGVLDGVPPAGGKSLSVKGADAQAWFLGDRIYLRTRLTVLSPGFMGKMVSPDGMKAYELPKTSSVLVSRFGEPVEMRVEGF